MTLPIEVVVKKQWRSGYWKNWYTALNFYDHSEIGNGGDIFVSESDDDVDEHFNWIDEAEASEADDYNHMWSVVGSPPFTDDARREGPADHDQQMQGGLSKAKPPSRVGDGSHIHSLGRPTLPESTAVSRFEAAEHASQYLPSFVKIACKKFDVPSSESRNCDCRYG